MKRSKEIAKAIKNLGLNISACTECGGTGRWVFFKNSGECGFCYGVGMKGGTSAIYKQVNDYIAYDLYVDEMLR